MLSPFEKLSLLHNIEKLWSWTNDQATATPCQACFFHGRDGMCRKWGEKIPKETLAVGCEEFIFDINSMPF